jgi:hypothetical protein
VGLLLVASATACSDVNPRRPAASTVSSAPAAGVGRLWRLVEIRHAGETVVVPGSLTATLQLTLDHQLLASDTVNALSGTYASTRSGFAVMSAGSTAVGYAGTDPTRLTVIAAMAAVAGQKSDVTAKLPGTALVLTVPDYELTFRDQGPAVIYPPASPTPTPTPTATSR